MKQKIEGGKTNYPKNRKKRNQLPNELIFGIAYRVCPTPTTIVLTSDLLLAKSFEKEVIITNYKWL